MSSCRFHVFMLFSDLRVTFLSDGQWRFPANFFHGTIFVFMSLCHDVFISFHVFVLV